MSDHSIEEADAAAIFGVALSLWEACGKAAANNPSLNLSDIFNGRDQLMREVMRIANFFERWACQHVMFEQLEDVWSYRMQDDFGEACMKMIRPMDLMRFDDIDCLRVALELKLPLKLSEGLRVPVDVHVTNPIPSSSFQQFRIQTVRDHLEDGDAHPFCVGDEPFDGEFGAPYFALFGVDIHGILEHIADRRTYAEVTALVRKLIPDVHFPEFPTATHDGDEAVIV